MQSNNLSLKGENIELTGKSDYYIIDALYLNDVKENLDYINTRNLEQELKEKVFPFTVCPIGRISTSDHSISISIDKIKQISEAQVSSSSFTSDSGLILLIRTDVFFKFLAIYNFDTLTEGLNDPVNIFYWNNVITQFPEKSCALILAPGINSGFEFVGSGLYSLTI